MPTANYNFPVPSGSDSFKAHRDFKALGDAIDHTIKSENDKLITTIAKQKPFVNVKEYGAIGDGIVDDTVAIRNALNASDNVFFPKGDYKISIPNTNRTALRWFTDKKNINITGDGATLVDANTYTTSALVNVFAFTRCKNIKIEGVNYRGNAITDPDNQLHNLGMTFAYFEEGCENIKVNAALENMRYGVRSGDYLNPTYGYCKDFKIDLSGTMLGYPVALYLAENAKINVDVNGVHRAVYLAGVHGAKVDCKTKNSYGATIQVLMTNSITTYSGVQSEQRARGCKAITVKVMDTGSTKFLPYTALCGIGLQWVAQGTEFSDIKVLFSVRSTDTVASSIAGFHLDSTAKVTNTYYPFNWEPYISIKNVEVAGTIDRTGQTVATNQAGEVYIRGYDTADVNYEHCPTVSNFSLKDIVIVKGAVQSRALYVELPNLTDVLKVENLQAPGIDIFAQARTGKVVFANSNVKALSVPSIIADLKLDNSTVNGIDHTKISKLTYAGFNLGLANTSLVMRQLTAVTTGAAVYTFTNAIKKASLTKSIVAVMPGYVSSGTWSMGVPGDSVFFGTAPLNNTNGYNRFSTIYYPANALPKYFDADKNLTLTFNPSGAMPTGQTITVFIFEEVFNI